MIENLADAIASLASGTYTVTRPGTPTLLNGRKVAASSTTFSIVGSVSPAPGKTLELLPEGYRGRAGVVVFTATKLQTAEGGQDPDLVSIGGQSYQVAALEDWSELGGYYRAVCVRLPT